MMNATRSRRAGGRRAALWSERAFMAGIVLAIAGAAVSGTTLTPIFWVLAGLGVAPGVLSFAPAPSAGWAHARRAVSWTAAAAAAVVVAGPGGGALAAWCAIAGVIIAVGAPKGRWLEGPVFAAAGYALALWARPDAGGISVAAAGWLSLAAFPALVAALSFGGRSEDRRHAVSADPARAAVTASPLPVLALNAEGRIQAAWGPTRDVFALPSAELIGQSLTDVVDRASAAAAQTVLTGADQDADITIFGKPARLFAAKSSSGTIVIAAPSPATSPDTAPTADARLQYFARLNHELRTPLNAILGFTDAMRQRLFGELSPKYGEYVGLVHTSAEHLLSLVTSVIDLSRIEAGAYDLDPVDHDAADVVHAVFGMMSVLADKAGVSLSVDAERPLWVHADPRAIRQILINLAANAIKFTPKNGTVTVNARFQGDDLVLAVTDTGPGMSDAEIAVLGRPFVQTEAGRTHAGDGAGLGLAIVRRLADLHGGRLTVSSAVGEGSTVGVSAPVRIAAPVAARRA